MASNSLTAVLLLALAAAPAWAHHDFAAEYNPDALVRLTGRVTSIQLANPHSTVQIEVLGEGRLGHSTEIVLRYWQQQE
jgi:hypothetical protein